MKLLAVMAALVLALTSTGAALAQEGPVVTGQAQGVTLKPGATATLALVLKVKQGYHINGHAPDDDSMIPTKVTMTPAAGFKLLRAGYPRPKLLKFAFSEKPIPVYEGAVQIPLTIQAAKDAAPGLHRLTLTVSYQACDNEACLMPEDLVVPIPVKVAP